MTVMLFHCDPFTLLQSHETDGLIEVQGCLFYSNVKLETHALASPLSIYVGFLLVLQFPPASQKHGLS